MPDLELTDEERKNGWDAETLTAYIAERERAQSGIVLHDPEYRKPKRPRYANNQYRPLKWR